MSLVYRKVGFEGDGSAPLLLYGYGSYGASMDATFSSARLSLLDRGFVYAIAHVRGGEELGRWWYEEGKLLNKMNTFTDFIDVAEFLVADGYADPARLFAMGGSAGGLLMGAVVNLRPELWRGVVAAVPFVDVVTTMLDETIPLTTSEYDEWGNPDDPEYFDYMLSYSPYDNVGPPGTYPSLLVTTGLHDSQVQYWEPAKWVARLRAVKTDGNQPLPSHEHGRGARRCVGPLPAPPGDGARVRVPARPGRDRRVDAGSEAHGPRAVRRIPTEWPTSGVAGTGSGSAREASAMREPPPRAFSTTLCF